MSRRLDNMLACTTTLPDWMVTSHLGTSFKKVQSVMIFRRGDRMIIINNSQGDWWEARLIRYG